MLTLRTLGRPRLDGPQGELLSGRRKELAVLAYLGRRHGSLPREELAELFWGSRPDANARQSLRQALLQLKRALPSGLEAEGDAVMLRRDALQLDANLFEADLAAGRLAEAVDRWQGDFLAGQDDAGGPAYGAWLDGQRQALRTRLRVAFGQLVERADRDGDADAALHWAERWAEWFPHDERAATRVIRGLYHAGRTGEALGRHAVFDSRLRQDLGIEASPDFARLAAELQGAAPAAPPAPASGALFTPELVGRRPALAALEGAWAAATAGTTTLVLVEGEDGIGKTRLIEEFIRGITSKVVLLRGRGSETSGRVPHAVLGELLTGLADAPGLSGARPSTLAALGAVVPAIRECFPPPADAAVAAWDDAVVDVLAAVATEAPVLLFVDDFPLADRESRDTLLTVARRVRQAALCCIFTSRTSDTPPPLVAELRGRAGETRIRLSALSESEVEGLLGSMLHLAPEARATVARRMHAESGGNPFYLVEAMAALVDEGWIAPDERGVWRPASGLIDGTLQVPATLRAALRRRVATLSPDARRAAAAAAVLTPLATRPCLAHVTQLGETELAGALEELELRRLLRAPSTGDGPYAFAHDISRRAMLEDLSGAERRRLQRRAMQALRGTAVPPGVTDAIFQGRRRRRRRILIGAGLGAAVIAVTMVIAALGLGRAAPPVYAVGRIQDYSGDQTAIALADMLTTGLARVSALSVVSTARMYELTGGDTASVLEAARRAGATVLLSGRLFKTPAGDYRLDLEGTAVKDGRVVSAERFEGADLFLVVDSATAAVARERGVPAPATALTAQTTTSLAAYRLYSEGLRALQLHHPEAARALLDAAVVEDSAFALAWLWSARAHSEPYAAWRRRMDHAVALAPRAPERERLLILWDFATRHDAPERLALAESLATRFPADAEAQLEFGFALQWDGQFLAAVDAFNRTLALDRGSLAAARAGERCLACEAVASLSGVFRMADSMDASVRVVQQWTRDAPGKVEAWHTLADALMYTGRAEEAFAAERVAAPLEPPDAPSILRALIPLHAAEDWDAGARFFGNEVERPEPAVQRDGLWWMIIIRRNQGRLNEALALARRYVALGGNRLPEAQVRFERGEYRAAARLFRAIAGAPPREEPASRQARETGWYLTHTATALAAAGDTASLLALADSVEALGRQTAYGRDRRLHHHIRGLLFAARGQREAAIESFRRAIFSPTGGYTRSNYELGRLLLDAGRPMEAVRALRPTLHGSLEASNYYLTRTEVHALLGRAFEAAGEPDSAVAHYRRAIASWRGADPAVAHERDELMRRMTAIARRVPRR